MRFQINFVTAVLVCLLLGVGPALAQQKAQWVPGQYGLDAGILPDRGLTLGSLNIDYSASQLNGPNGNKISGVSGTYSFWASESILLYVPKVSVLGGKLALMALLPVANGSLTAELNNPLGNNVFPFGGGGFGYADSWFQPLTLGWHFNRVDTFVDYAFTAPTGRYSPGANNNLGSGYWGNNIESNTTAYLTKNKGTTANLAADWEVHGQREAASVPAGQITNVTPGQAFTMEWGLGQFLPLNKQQTQLLEVGVIGYDQWQVTANGGNYLIAGRPVPASLVPFYSVHAIGFQTNYILPAKNLNFFFKFEPEYLAHARPQGRTIAFGISYTFKFPKTQKPAP